MEGKLSSLKGQNDARKLSGTENVELELTDIKDGGYNEAFEVQNQRTPIVWKNNY